MEPAPEPLPLVSAAYLVVMGEQNPHVLDEFVHSFASLREHHAELPVFVYHHGLSGAQLAFVRRLRGVVDFPIAPDRSGRFRSCGWMMKSGELFPSLGVLAAKIDVLLLTPGNTLFLDADTEVREPLDEVLLSEGPWMHACEGLMRAHERPLASMLAATPWAELGWCGDLDRLRMFNSGVVWVPEPFKRALFRAKEYLWHLLDLPAEERGDNRLDEQIAISIALEEASGYGVREVAPRVHHFWRERYEGEPAWYRTRFSPTPEGALAPPEVADPELAPLLD